MKTIYFDHAATTAVAPEVKEAMEPYFCENYGNASSLYELGYKSKEAINIARVNVAKAINTKPNEIYFTSCGSESDNLALKGVARAHRQNRNHIITSRIEHPAVLNTCRQLEKEGFKVTYLDVDKNGFIDLEELKNSINSKTILVSIMFANNEVGTIEPIKEISRIVHSNNAIFHTDAVQAFGHIEIDVKKIGADMLSASSHKFHGPKGCGFLYADKNTGIKPFIYGGGQERGQRSGTENVPGILGMVKAAEISHRIMDENNRKLRKINDYMTDRILNEIDDCICNGNRENRLSNNINVSFGNIDGKALLVLLDMEGVYVSGASACNGGKEKSYVLSSLGVPEKYADGTIRMTMDYTMNMKQADYVLNVLKKCVNYLRKK